MPAKPISVNLLGQQDLGHTPWGRIVAWATTYGRYIMITTEIVVLLAFISRFSLDRKLTDLTEEVTQKQAIIEANASFEKEIKSVQTNLARAKELIVAQPKPIALVTLMETLLPPDVYLTSFDITASKLTGNAVAGTTNGFSQFLANLGSVKELQNVTLGDINKQGTGGIEFQFTAEIAGAPKPK